MEQTNYRCVGFLIEVNKPFKANKGDVLALSPEYLAHMRKELGKRCAHLLCDLTPSRIAMSLVKEIRELAAISTLTVVPCPACSKKGAGHICTACMGKRRVVWPHPQYAR